MLLALDTSTSQASVALVQDERLLAEWSWEVGRRHSQELPERMSQVLRAAGALPADLTGVAVALGPGSFNGARVAVTTAKLLALALGIRVYGAATLDAIGYGYAIGHACADGTLVALLEAGRDEVYTAVYTVGEAASGADGADAITPGLWRFAGPAIVSPANLPGLTPGGLARAPLVCGEWRDETAAEVRAAFGADVRFAPRLGGRRAVWLAGLLAERIARGASDDPARLEPLYLRRPAITASARPENQAGHSVIDGTPAASRERG